MDESQIHISNGKKPVYKGWVEYDLISMACCKDKAINLVHSLPELSRDGMGGKG